MKKILLRLLFPVAVSFFCLYLAGRTVNWHEFATILKNAKLWPLSVAAVLWSFSFLLRGVRWKLLLDPFQKISPLRLSAWQVGGLLINNLLPLRMGDIARGYWAGHKTSIAKSTVLATIFIERVWDIGTLFFVAVLIFIVLGVNSQGGMSVPQLLGILALLGAFGAGFFWSYKRGWLSSGIAKVQGRMPASAQKLMHHFVHGFSIMKSPLEIVKLTAVSLFTWTMDITTIAILSRCVGLQLNWFESGLAIIGLVLGVMIPAAPGSAGTYEAGGVAALTLIGVPTTLAFSYILLMHVFQYVYVIFLGVPILIAEGFNPRTLFQKEISAESNS